MEPLVGLKMSKYFKNTWCGPWRILQDLKAGGPEDAKCSREATCKHSLNTCFIVMYQQGGYVHAQLNHTGRERLHSRASTMEQHWKDVVKTCMQPEWKHIKKYTPNRRVLDIHLKDPKHAYLGSQFLEKYKTKKSVTQILSACNTLSNQWPPTVAAPEATTSMQTTMFGPRD